MNHTVISLVTVGSAMLLWKLLTGESRGAVEEAQQVQESREESKNGLSAEPSYSSYGEAAEISGSFANADASTGWTDASSQHADEDTTEELQSSPKRSPSQHTQRQLVAPVPELQHDDQAELLGSESYISAASAEDDSQEVFSSPVHSPAKQPTATSPQSREAGVTVAPDTIAVPAERSALGFELPQQVSAAGSVADHQQLECQQQKSLQQEEGWDPHSTQSEAQDSSSLQQLQQQQAADAHLAGLYSPNAASSSTRHKRSSSSDRITFGPIEPRFSLGGFLGQWDSAGAASAADRLASELTEQEQQQQHDDDLAADEADRETSQPLEQGQHGQQEQSLEDQQQQVPDTLTQQQRLQQRKLQPLNFAAADTALQEQHAMTDSLWASLRTVEVPQKEAGGQVSAADEATSPGRPRLPPRPPSAAGPAPAAGGAVERASSSDSEDYGQNSLTLPADITSAVGPGTPRSNAAAAAAAPSNAGHLRQPSRARANSGSLHGSLGDWPSIQLQSVPSDSTVTQQTAETGSCAATSMTSGKQGYSQSQQEHQPPLPPAAQVRDIQQQEPGHAASVGSDLGHAEAHQQSIDAMHSARATAGSHEHSALPQTEESVQSLAETLPPSRWERQQQQQPGDESRVKQLKQQQLAQLGDNSVAQQQPADDMQQPMSLQQEPQAIVQSKDEPQQPRDKQQLQEQQQHLHQHQQQPLLLQSESTLPAPAGDSSNTYHTNSLSKQQQHHWKQQLQQGQQQQLGSDQPQGQPTGATEPRPLIPAASRQGSKTQMLHAAETVTLHGSTGSSSSSRPSHQQLPTQAAVADRDSSGGSGEFDPLLADLAAGLTAPRNWRPSRHQGSMLGTTHSKLSVMTTAADDKLQRLSSSLQRRQQGQENHLCTAAVPSSSGASSAGNAAATAADVDGPWLRLVVSSGPAAGKSFHSQDRTAELVIGRSPVCWASIADQEISGKHACVSWSSTHHCWQVVDAGSLNGTSHNGAVISKAGRASGQPVLLTHGDKLDLGSMTSAVVECGAGQQHQAAAGQQQQQHEALGHAATALDIAAGDGQPSQHQQQRLADPICLQQQHQQQGAELPVMPPNQQQQQERGVDSRYSTWTAGHARPTIASPSSSSSSNHRSSMLDSPAAAAAALYGTHGSAGISGNGSYHGSSSGSGSRRSSLLQTHYRTGGGLSSACSSSCHGGSPSSPGGAVLAPLMLLQFPGCRIEGAVAKVVGADHRRNQMPCEDVVAWRTPLAHWPQVGLFCVFDGHHSRHASEQAQDLLPRLLSQHLQLPQQQQQHVQLPGQHDEHILQQQQQGALLANEPAVAAALTASFLETDKQLTCEDGCTATAVLLEGCGDGSVMLRVANVGDSMALLVDLANSGWRCLTEDHRIAGNAAEAARLSAKNNNVPGGVSTRLYGLNIARMLGDRFLKEQDVGFSAEPYVSEGVVLGPKDEMLVVVASDGLWDVVSQERAAGMAGKIAAERARAAGPSVAGARAVDSAGSSAGIRNGSDRLEAGMQDASGGNSSVAAAVAEALMHAALSLRSKDDISIMVLHVLPAAVAGRKVAAGSVTVSGSI